jgi:hypothetical protein
MISLLCCRIGISILEAVAMPFKFAYYRGTTPQSLGELLKGE